MDTVVEPVEGMAKSTHKAEVVPVSLRKHENADSLSIIDVWGFTCVGRTADWQERTKAIFIPPDTLVDTSREEFSFLKSEAKSDGFARIKAKRLRGVWSYGLLTPAPEEAQLGEDWYEKLGLRHYEPNVPGEYSNNITRADDEKAPSLSHPLRKYDIDSFMRYGKNIFRDPSEPLFVTEKIHGCCATYIFFDGKLHLKTRTRWVKDDGVNVWSKALAATPSIRVFCEANPGVALFGECVGVQNMRYGLEKGEVGFRAFDVYKDNQWMDAADMLKLLDQYEVPIAPVIYEGIPLTFEQLILSASGPSLIGNANHFREGCVVRPMKERWDDRLGRAQLKIINPEYLAKG